MGDKPQNSGSRPNPRADFGDAALAGAVVTASSPAGRKATAEAVSLAGKYGLGTVKLAGGAIGLVGAPLVLGISGHSAYENASNGRLAAAGFDLLPVLPEMYEVGLAANAFRLALSQGTWAAARAGGGALITGSSLAVGVGGGIALMLVADLGMSAARESGFDVDQGYLMSHVNRITNVETAAKTLFQGDTGPIPSDWMSNMSMSQSIEQTGVFEWKTLTTFNTYSEVPVYTPPIEGHIVQTGIGTFWQNELKYFGTFHGNYFFKDEKGQVRPDTEMNQIAQGMYEDPNQSFGLFRELVYKRTIETALRIAKERDIKVAEGGAPLGPDDKIPPALMSEAASLTLSNFRNSYQLAGDRYFERALAFTDPKFVRPENINIAKLEAWNFIENRFSGNIESFIGDKGGFNWSNSVHLARLHSSIDEAIERNRPATPIAPPVRRAPPPGRVTTIEPLKTLYDAENIHKANQSVIDRAMTNYLIDPQTGYFDHTKLLKLQQDLVQAGHLSGTYDTGTMNGHTMRAIDRAIKMEMQPGDIMDEERPAILDQATKFTTSLKDNPADSSTFDPRVLSLQTNAYFLGLYDGKLDGLSGPKTLETMQKIEQFQQPARAPKSAAPAVAAPEVTTAPALQPSGP